MESFSLLLFYFYPIRQLYKFEIIWVLGKLLPTRDVPFGKLGIFPICFLISHKIRTFQITDLQTKRAFQKRIIQNTDRTFKNLTSLTMETLARMSMAPSLPAPTYSQSNARTGVGGPLEKLLNWII